MQIRIELRIILVVSHSNRQARAMFFSLQRRLHRINTIVIRQIAVKNATNGTRNEKPILLKRTMVDLICTLIFEFL